MTTLVVIVPPPTPSCLLLFSKVLQATKESYIGCWQMILALGVLKEQYSIVHVLTIKMHEVECYVHLKQHVGHVNCTINSLLLLGNEDCHILHLHVTTYSTPKCSNDRLMSSTSIYHTPQSTSNFWGDASLPSSAGIPSPGLSLVKVKLQDLLNSLDATHIVWCRLPFTLVAHVTFGAD